MKRLASARLGRGLWLDSGLCFPGNVICWVTKRFKVVAE